MATIELSFASGVGFPITTHLHSIYMEIKTVENGHKFGECEM